jgi:hypothetical protein
MILTGFLILILGIYEEIQIYKNTKNKNDLIFFAFLTLITICFEVWYLSEPNKISLSKMILDKFGIIY